MGADLADGRAVVFAEIGDHLVIGDKPAQQPNHFEVAARFAFQTAARLHPVEIAINVKLQMNGG